MDSSPIKLPHQHRTASGVTSDIVYNLQAVDTIERADLSSSSSERKVSDIGMTRVFIDSVYSRRKDRGEIRTDFVQSTRPQ